jgi:hypothetical protein
MIQQEIKFFYPLTEQIPLDLIYEETEPKLWTSLGVTSGSYLMSTGATTSYVTSHLTIDCDNVRFQSKKKHTFIQKLMFRAMGIKVQDNGR